MIRLRLKAIPCAVALAGVALVAWAAFGSVERTSRRPGGAVADRRQRELAQLAGELVPSVGGGWVVIAPSQEPAPDRQLQAAAALAAPDARVREAAAATAAQLAEPELQRQAALALATTAVDPRVADALPPGTLDRVWEVTEPAFASDPSWLAIVLNLALGSGEVADRAAAVLTDRAGHPTCDVLPAAGEDLPGPDAELTVAVSLLAAQGQRCEGASAVLERALADPRWQDAVAVPEVADLAAIAGGDLGRSAPVLAAQADRWTDPGDDEVADLSRLVHLRRLRRLAGLDAGLPLRVRLRLEAQVSSAGRLPDRSTAPASAFDVAIVRQLGAEGLVPVEAVRATEGAADLEGDEAAAFLVGGEAPSCDRALEPAPGNLAGLIAKTVAKVAAARCDGDLDPRVVQEAIDHADRNVRPVVAWAAIIAACRLEPDLDLGDVAEDLDLTGPLAGEPLWRFGASVAADPVGACRAERAS